MLSPIAYANSQAIVSRAVCLALYVLAVVWRDAFRFVFNAQSLGADVASLLPHKRAVSRKGKRIGTAWARVQPRW